METTGKLTGVSRDWQTRRLILSFTVEPVPADEIDRLAGLEEIEIKADQKRNRRSLNANSYFHVLAGKIAEAVGSGKTEVKNRLIREYGQYEFAGDMIPTFMLKSCYVETMLNREDMHVKPVGSEFRDGEQWTRLAFMRGSHTYDTKEMKILIDGTVAEAKELGIETLTPQELERMVSAWKGGITEKPV